MEASILHVTGELLYSRGLKKLTMDEIAQQLGVSKKTLYKYFDSKQTLVTTFFQTVYETDVELTNTILSDTSLTVIEKLYEIVASYEHTYLTVQVCEEARQYFPIQWKQLEQIRATKVEAMTALLSEVSKTMQLRNRYTKELIIIMVDQWCHLMMQKQFHQIYEPYDTKAMAIAFVDIMLYGCVEPKQV